jgi:hypothetical protein
MPLLLSSGVASAADIIITGSNGNTNGIGTIDGGAEAAIGASAGDGSDTVSLGVALTLATGNRGIFTSGDNNNISISSSGSITTSGPSSDALWSIGSSNTITMSGSITAGGSGIWHLGGSNTTNMSGNITTAGANVSGIFNQGSSNATTMSGNITTAGTNAHGIFNSGSSNTTTMSGSITTDGVTSHGIYLSGSNNIATISGIINTTRSTSSALLSSIGSGNSFTLGEGATIMGEITAEASTSSNKLILNLGQGTSYAYSVGGDGVGIGAGQWTFSDQDGRTPVVTTSGTNCSTGTVCNLVTAIGSGNAMEQDELQFETNRSMIGSLVLGNRQTSTLTEAMPSTQASKSTTWANVYGGASKRAASTTHSSFDTRNAGLTIGIPVAINGTFNVDLVFNTSSTNLDIGLTKDQEITAKSYNIGAVVHDLAPATSWAVDAFGFIGRNSYDGKRKVMNNDTATGSETVTASYSGMEVLVGIDAQYSTPINETLSFIGGMSASLSNEKMDAYSESKYFAWDARTMTQAIGGITAGLEHRTDALTTFASLDAQRSSLRSGKTAGYTNNGTAGSYTDSANGDTYRTASIGFDYAGAGGISVTGAVERLTSSGGVSGNSTSLSVNRKF